MTQWEYDIISKREKHPKHFSLWKKELNKRGEEGWELIQWEVENFDDEWDHVLVFKRKIEK